MEKLGIECKRLIAEEIKERLKGSSNLFVTSFKAMAVSEQDQLRRKLKEIDASFFVLKNRIAKRVFNQSNLESLTTLFQGLMAITLGGRDYLTVSKVLVNFADKHKNFKILGAYVDEQLLDPTSIKRLATIPSKEVLLAQVVYGFKSPIQGLVNSLSATVRKFVVVINKICGKK